jgi:DNA polymerase-1
MIKFSKFLATIKTDVPIDFQADELLRKEIDEPALRKIFDELEFRQLSARVFGEAKKVDFIAKKAGFQADLFTDFSAVSSEESLPSSLDDIKSIPHEYHILEDAKIPDFIERIKAQKSLTFDTETTGLEPFAAELVGMSFALKPGEAYYLPISSDFDEAKRLAGMFKEVLEDTTIVKIGQNLKFDINVLKK